MEVLSFGEQVKIILSQGYDNKRTGGIDRGYYGEEDVPAESDAAAWER